MGNKNSKKSNFELLSVDIHFYISQFFVYSDFGKILQTSSFLNKTYRNFNKRFIIISQKYSKKEKNIINQNDTKNFYYDKYFKDNLYFFDILINFSELHHLFYNKNDVLHNVIIKNCEQSFNQAEMFMFFKNFYPIICYLIIVGVDFSADKFCEINKKLIIKIKCCLSPNSFLSKLIYQFNINNKLRSKMFNVFKDFTLTMRKIYVGDYDFELKKISQILLH